MSVIKTFSPGSIGLYDYVVLMSHYERRLLLSRHRDRSTWEMQGGHIEPGESPEKAAARELYEESGAAEFELTPLCDYCGEEPGRQNYGRGMVFLAEIHKMGKMPASEMEEVRLFEEFPDQLTYPNITEAVLNFYQNEKRRFHSDD